MHKKTIKLITSLFLLIIISSGCVSHSVFKESEKIIAERKAIEKNDEAGMRSIKSGEIPEEYKAGFIDTIKERPWVAAGGAVADAAIAYGAYEAVQWLSNSGSDSGSSSETSNLGNTQSSTVTVSGDNNSVVVTSSASSNESTNTSRDTNNNNDNSSN